MTMTVYENDELMNNFCLKILSFSTIRKIVDLSFNLIFVLILHTRFILILL